MKKKNIIVDPTGPELCITPSNPMPEGGRVAYMRTSDNVQLRYALWRPRGRRNKGTICLVHGRTEFIEKYFETINDFLERGFAVATFDWRGQGGSDRLIGNKKLGYVDQFSDYFTDLQSFHADILLPDCPPPYYLVGHSMGGLVSLKASTYDRMMFDRIFLSAPMVEVLGHPLSMAGMARFAETLCFFGLGHLAAAPNSGFLTSKELFPGNTLTSDFERYSRSIDIFKERPDLEILAPSLRWAATAFREMALAADQDFPQKMKIPVLMLAAARDEVVSSDAIEQLGLQMRIGHHAVIGAARHELFMENDNIRGQVFAAFDAFVTDQSVV